MVLTVDDEPKVGSAIERDLRHQFVGDNRKIRAGSGAEALENVRQLKQRSIRVAGTLWPASCHNLTPGTSRG